VTRLLVLPQALVVALFPAFAATYEGDRARTAVLYERAQRVVLVVMFPVLLAVVLFAREGLTAWVGASFAASSTAVLQWLAVGVFINAVAQAPFVVMQSTGRPDVTAKLHLAELPIYLGALWWMAHRYGLVGVAMAWSLRSAIDAAALLVLAGRRLPGTARHTTLALAAVLGLPLVLGAGALLGDPLSRAAFLAGAFALFGAIGWTLVIPEAQRAGLLAWVRGPRRGPAPD
jgi:O-antigen/teichoic acid export membrane protein